MNVSGVSDPPGNPRMVQFLLFVAYGQGLRFPRSLTSCLHCALVADPFAIAHRYVASSGLERLVRERAGRPLAASQSCRVLSALPAAWSMASRAFRDGLSRHASTLSSLAGTGLAVSRGPLWLINSWEMFMARW